MKQKNIKIIISAIIALIILAGIVVVNIWGFNKELQYEKGQSIEIYLEEKADIAKIKDIVNNELGTKNKVQTVEIYEDMVIIRAQSISEEQKNNIVNKIKENYQYEASLYGEQVYEYIFITPTSLSVYTYNLNSGIEIDKIVIRK